MNGGNNFGHPAFSNGGVGSVIAARTPDGNEFEYNDHEELGVVGGDFEITKVPGSDHRMMHSPLTEDMNTTDHEFYDENEELIHHTPQRPLQNVWPAQAIALLDSAAPEHVMYSTIKRGTPRSGVRHSLLPGYC